MCHKTFERLIREETTQATFSDQKTADAEQHQPKPEWEEEFELMRSQGRLGEWLMANSSKAQKTGAT